MASGLVTLCSRASWPLCANNLATCSPSPTTTVVGGDDEMTRRPSQQHPVSYEGSSLVVVVRHRVAGSGCAAAISMSLLSAGWRGDDLQAAATSRSRFGLDAARGCASSLIGLIGATTPSQPSGQTMASSTGFRTASY